MLNGSKWDPQVNDISTLAPFPLVMTRTTWDHIAADAEHLAAETIVAEQEILSRPELLRELGLPSALHRVLVGQAPITPAVGRIMRFDFHLTTDGWRISEVNSDVPGGFTEASHFTSLMAEHYPGLLPAGDPVGAWADALASVALEEGGKIALVSAPGYMEDFQVVACLAEHLRARGCDPHLANPLQIVWRDGIAHLNTAWYCGPVALLVRFYQAEWLARLPTSTDWRNFLRDGKTLVSNPIGAVISESKRFPLLWGKLSSPMPTWRRLLPETCDPRGVPWQSDGDWLLKTSMCNTGDTITLFERLPRLARLQTRVAVRLSPRSWVAQRRFESVPISTPEGLRHVCVGVYVINGKATGAYVRMSTKDVIDFEATDVALLIQNDD